jgi:hypothetical protein
MGWIFTRPLLTLIELVWRWIFAIPFLYVCSVQYQQILTAVPPSTAGLDAINSQNPWQASVQLAHILAIYEPHVLAVLGWLAPAGALAWIVVSALGRSLLFKRLGAQSGSPVRFRPLAMMVMQTGWLVVLWSVCLGWFNSMAWVASTHITAGKDPDLVGFASWAIFLSLGYFTLWALVSWTFSIAPLVMLGENRSALSAIACSFKLGREFTGKLIEINLVMGIVNLALIVLAMVLSAAPLPFSDELGPAALHRVAAVAVLFYLVSSDYFQVVRLKGFQEFWNTYRGSNTPQ